MSRGSSGPVFREEIRGLENQIFDRRQVCYGREMPESISSSITGIQLRDTLLREAGMDLRKLKSIISDNPQIKEQINSAFVTYYNSMGRDVSLNKFSNEITRSNYYLKNSYENILKYISNTPWTPNIKNFYTQIKILDQRRNQSAEKTFSQLFKELKNV